MSFFILRDTCFVPPSVGFYENSKNLKGRSMRISISFLEWEFWALLQYIVPCWLAEVVVMSQRRSTLRTNWRRHTELPLRDVNMGTWCSGSSSKRDDRWDSGRVVWHCIGFSWRPSGAKKITTIRITISLKVIQVRTSNRKSTWLSTSIIKYYWVFGALAGIHNYYHYVPIRTMCLLSNNFQISYNKYIYIAYKFILYR